MIGLLRTVLIILLIYYGLRILSRVFGPAFMRYASKKAQQQFDERHNRQQPRNTPREGEVSIDKRPPRKSESDAKVGEYIDFEEID